MRILVITVSDRAYKGIYQDKSGEIIIKTLEEELKDKIINKIIIPDEYDIILNTLENNKDKFDIIITTGGTGLSQRDVTPEATMEFLKKSDLLFEEDNALWFKSTLFGDDKDRVVKKSNGSYTYFAPDITYHKTKVDRGYNTLIDILGADHHGYVPRITAAVRAVSNDSATLNVILGQLVRLFRGKELVRMSKRTGDMISLEEVIDEIGVDSTRYFLLMRSYSSSLDFDLELAKKRDNDNPVYYVQYAYARICNIFFKLQEKNMTYDDGIDFDITDISNETTLKLAKMILRFPDEVYECSKSLEVYTLLSYMYEVSSALHKFYYENIVLDDDDNIRNQRLKLVNAVKKVLGICFDIIGITKLEKMW